MPDGPGPWLAQTVSAGPIRLLKKYIDEYRRTEAIMDRLAMPVEDLPGGYEQWVGDSMRRLLEQFGREPLERPIVRPADLLLGFDGTEAATRSLFTTVCRRMDVPVDRIEFRLGPLRPNPKTPTGPLDTPRGGPVGRWFRDNGRGVVTVVPSLMDDPDWLVSVLAHELGHELLIGSGRVEPSRPDLECLTDLLTVFYGFGIFAANASIALPAHVSGRGKAPVARGYLRQEALALALAHYCVLRGERRHPAWKADLDFLVRARMVGRVHQLRSGR